MRGGRGSTEGPWSMVHVGGRPVLALGGSRLDLTPGEDRTRPPVLAEPRSVRQ